MFPTLIDFGFFRIDTFEVFFLIGIAMGVFLTWKQAKIRLYNENDVFDTLFISLFFAIIGARLSYVAINYESFGLQPLLWIATWVQPGLYLFGGILGGAIALFVTSKLKKEFGFWEALDLFTFSFWIAILFGLIGSFLAGYEVGSKSPVSGIDHPVTLYRLVGLGILLMPYLAYRSDKDHRTSIHARSGLFSLLFAVSFSLVWFIVDFVSVSGVHLGMLLLDQWIMLIVLCLSVALLVKYHRDWFYHVYRRALRRKQ